MTLSLTTQSRPAFESMNDGLRAIDRYYRERKLADIQNASERVDAALSEDGNYGLAIFYKGVVLDLIGKPADAPCYFERVLKECDSRELELETLFNLGVVNYHRYSHPFLAPAKEYFDRVIHSNAETALKNMAKAHLAQTHAMWMRPSHSQLPVQSRPVAPEVRQHIEEHFQQCQRLVKDLRCEQNTDPRLIATFENANGMAHMYYTDHIAIDPVSRRKYLELARQSLLEADRQLPGDWANTCDLGSLELRLGVLQRADPHPGITSDQHFQKSRERLESVITTLRPGYGFALYELGILHRVWGKWSEADTYLVQALEVPVEYRDISNEQVQEQLSRVEAKDESYP
jgi:hypothetical protein